MLYDEQKKSFFFSSLLPVILSRVAIIYYDVVNSLELEFSMLGGKAIENVLHN